MDHDEYENSSDIDFGTGPVPDKVYGQDSIDRMIADAPNLRRVSKKAWKLQEYGHGCPSSVEAQRRWANRLDAFRGSVLNQQVDKPFDIETLIRFLDSILGRRSLNEKAPSFVEKGLLIESLKASSARSTAASPFPA